MTARVLVTGGSGFIGTNLVQSYLESEDDVVNLDVCPPRNTAHAPVWNNVDLLDSASLVHAITEYQPDLVYHLGARTDLHGKQVGDYAVNVAGLRNVITAVDQLPPSVRVVFASSRMVCRIGHQPGTDDEYSPPNAYGESKRLGEIMVREAGLRCTWTVVRPTSIWGPWFRTPYRDFFTSVQRGRYVHPRGMEIEKSFGFVLNTIYQLRALVTVDSKVVHGRTFYLGDYPPIEVGRLASTIAATSGAPRVRQVPMWLLSTLALAGDVLKLSGWEEPPLTRFRLDNLITPMVYDLSGLEAVVGELPWTSEQGVEETVDWMARHG